MRVGPHRRRLRAARRSAHGLVPERSFLPAGSADTETRLGRSVGHSETATPARERPDLAAARGERTCDVESPRSPR